mgnify:FL=1
MHITTGFVFSGISKLTTHTAHTGAHHAHRRTPRTPRTPAHTTHTEVIGGPKYVYTYERLARRFRSAGVYSYVHACCVRVYIVYHCYKLCKNYLYKMRPVFVPAELRVHPAPQRSHLKRQLERRLEQVVETCVLALAKCLSRIRE